MSQILQNLLLAHTLDIGVKNSIFVLLQQAVDRLEVKYSADVFKSCLDTLSALASDRAKFCREEMGVNEVIGKAVLHSMVNGSACPEDYKDQPGVQKLRDLSRFLRWLACSLMPKEFEAIMEDKQKDKGWAEATMSATLYFAIEDHILSLFVKAAQAKEPPTCLSTLMGSALTRPEWSSKGVTAITSVASWRRPSWRTLAMRCNWQSRSTSRVCSWSPRLALTRRS